MGRFRTRRVGWAAAFGVLVALFLGACSLTRTAESIAVLQDLAAEPEVGEDRAAVVEADGFSRETITFTVAGRTHVADLYTPAEGALAGMVLVPGAARRGKDDPRLVAFAETMARARFEVLVPDVPRMRSLQVSSADAEILADAAAFQDSRAPGRPLGMAAISFAAGPAVLSLFQEDAVDFLVTVGGYYDLEDAITFFTTGHYRDGPGQPWRHREPNAYGKWVFVLSNAARMEDPADREALFELAYRKIDDLDADVADLVGGLGPEGRSVYALLTNTDPDRVPALLGGLPAGMQDEIRALDLKHLALGHLPQHFVLLHGRGDPIIPVTQSRAFAEAVAAERSHLYVLDSLRHVEQETPGLVDTITLLQAVYRVLGLREGVGLSEDEPAPAS